MSGDIAGEGVATGGDVHAGFEVQAGADDDEVGEADGSVIVTQVKLAEDEENFDDEDFVTQKDQRRTCVQNYRLSLMKKKKVQNTSQSIQMFHRNYTSFVRIWNVKDGHIS